MHTLDTCYSKLSILWGVPIRWTEALDWTTGLDYWTRVILCKSVNDVITNRPPSCVVRVASIGSLCEWI